jgi:putative chitinase
MPFDRKVFFDSVRPSLFSGGLSQSQVDGMNAVLNAWDDEPPSDDLRWLAYCFATDYHETAQEMQPIEEYGKGADHEYGEVDPETGHAYYGRGYVQLTWRDNYQKATDKLKLEDTDDLVWYADQALDPYIAAEVMFRGMVEGWFRSGNTLGKFFNASTEDAYGAREIINGDKHIVPSWSNGVSIGNLIKGYYQKFLTALKASYVQEPVPEPVPEEVASVVMALESDRPVRISITCGPGVEVVILS